MWLLPNDNYCRVSEFVHIPMEIWFKVTSSIHHKLKIKKTEIKGGQEKSYKTVIETRDIILKNQKTKGMNNLPLPTIYHH